MFSKAFDRFSRNSAINSPVAQMTSEAFSATELMSWRRSCAIASCSVEAVIAVKERMTPNNSVKVRRRLICVALRCSPLWRLLRGRAGSSAMMRVRSASLIDAQRAISSSVRAQPMQRWRAASSVQILVQGL